jgi:hypothetical protein
MRHTIRHPFLSDSAILLKSLVGCSLLCAVRCSIMLAAISAAKAAPAAPAARRQQPTSLPRVCFAYDKSRKAVLGLFVVSECSRLPDNAGIVFWRVERAVALDDAPILDAADVAWSSAILH